MAAEELDGADVSWHGLAGDRRRAGTQRVCVADDQGTTRAGPLPGDCTFIFITNKPFDITYVFTD